MTTTINGTITQSTIDKIADRVSITSRSGSGTSKSGTFYLDTIQSVKTFTGSSELYKTHHFTYSISIQNYGAGQRSCVRNWVMYYNRQNKNGTWAKQWSYVTVDSTLMDSIIGAEKRIEIENTITNELVTELNLALLLIETAITKDKENN